MPTFQHDSISFHYADEGDGIPLILQHGLTADIRQPLEIAPAVEGVRLVRMDMRGHGETHPLGPEAGFTFAQMAADVLALADHLRLGAFVIGGISMGAGIALSVASLQPGRVRGLILIRPAWLDEPAPPSLEVMREAGRYIQQFGVTVGKSRFQESALYRAVAAQVPYAAQGLLAQFDHPRAAEAVVRLLSIPGSQPVGDRAAWSQLAMPTLIIGNAHDPTHPLSMAQALAAWIPNSRFIEVPPKAVSVADHNAAVIAGIGGWWPVVRR
jgi:pimeloyl-ACP methyl ester carboxylesterase